MKLVTVALACGFAAAGEATPVPSWKCALKNCALTSPLAKEGPGFLDGVNFFAAGSNGKDARQACPFGGGDDEPEPSDKEYMKYMNALDAMGDMNDEQRRAFAIEHADDPMPEQKAKKIKAPTVDLSAPGVHAVNSTQWSELRHANKYDMLIVFYAPWCPHCKTFVKGKNAPINAISESLSKAGGPKVVTFDMVADKPPLNLDSVPTVYLFKRNGMAVLFEKDTSDLKGLMSFALDKPASNQKAVAFLKQDPCAGCDESGAQAYQKCAMAHGNPCAETNAAGIVGKGPGQKKDIGCCMKKEKHDRCLQCKGMDCAHGTCKVNQKYYSSRTMKK